MLLTGFDAPILQTMYLDKPLKEHRLLQAIARTNRPYKDLKEAGLIIDYVGILKEFTQAFENYTKEDITGVLSTINKLTQEFTQTIDETMALFQDIPKDQYDRQTMLKAFETITTNEQNAKKFQQNYRHLRKLFELLGTHEIKLQKLKEYAWLTQVYGYYIHWLRQERYEEYRYVQKYFQKTLKYVYKTTQLADIEKQYPTIQFDADYLKNLQEKAKTKEEKAANILFTLNRFIIIDKHKKPHLRNPNRKSRTHPQTLERKNQRLRKNLQRSHPNHQRNKPTPNPPKTTRLHRPPIRHTPNSGKNTWTDKNLTQDIQELTSKLQPQMFKGWQYQQTTRKTIEREIRKYLRKYIKQYGISLSDLGTTLPKNNGKRENLWIKTQHRIHTRLPRRKTPTPRIQNRHPTPHIAKKLQKRKTNPRKIQKMDTTETTIS